MRHCCPFVEGLTEVRKEKITIGTAQSMCATKIGNKNVKWLKSMETKSMYQKLVLFNSVSIEL
jgi:hypothetical protein